MNILFLDFDGPINTFSSLDETEEETAKKIEERVQRIAKICHENNCKVILESAHRDCIDEETLTSDINWIQNILDLCKKYDIEIIGLTPYSKIVADHGKYTDYDQYRPVNKEEDIRLYLMRHPEVEHYCIIDDDDAGPAHSDLNKVRNHLVMPTQLDIEHPENEGLLDKHIEEAHEVFKKDNEVRRLLLKYKK